MNECVVALLDCPAQAVKLENMLSALSEYGGGRESRNRIIILVREDQMIAILIEGLNALRHTCLHGIALEW